ncbi:hypothetical protein [Marisediminicola senii]|uniref:hypothetical protein n=1 Tax=Marisediminicola senii TaxID=2711233 RepID=UPI0013EDAECD|nr:hypothetical protein [Marisediminicola senii]
MNQLNGELNELQEEVPPEADVETFIDEVTLLAAESGVILTAFTAEEPIMFSGVAVPEGEAAATTEQPAEVAAPDAATATSTSAASATGLEGRLFTIGVSIEVTGSPEQVLDFTGAVQEGNRLFLSTAVEFAADADPATGTIAGYIFVVRSTPGAVVETPAG